METQEKLNYVIRQINELFLTCPAGEVAYFAYAVTHPDNEDWTILTPQEQNNILKKFEESGYIKNLKQDPGRPRRFFLEKGVKYNEIQHQVKNIDGTASKSSADYIVEAMNFFKNEYNKTRLKGLEYEYILGSNKEYLLGMLDDELVYEICYKTDENANAMKRLADSGFVTEYKIDSKTLPDNDYVDFAICKINEGMITGNKEPEANQEKIDDITQEVIRHEMVHRFENSIQEAPIELNLTQEDKTNKKANRNSKYPHKIPSGTKWEEITINFIDERNVDIRVPTCDTLHTSYADMGFADGRNGNPTKQWELFQLLAKRGGSLPPDDKEVGSSYKKAKQNLETQLKDYFGFEYDFFKKYNTKDGYVAKVTMFFSENPKDTTNPQSSSDEVQEMFEMLSKGE